MSIFGIFWIIKSIKNRICNLLDDFFFQLRVERHKTIDKEKVVFKRALSLDKNTFTAEVIEWHPSDTSG